MPPEETVGTEWKFQLYPVLMGHTHSSELKSHQGERIKDAEQQNNKSPQITSLMSKHSRP